ncbi:hypothetical protein NE237_015481 [Protea cynaroides]|uniref:Pectinesterase inhibitor domain-containing protein n=1 Tax=Protea cynaroides TaxID=273540 RepID=A0A9Q0KE49_9MAGN|nr:hypothetical protein NE237_015481 [Protea cynaroides]
MGDQKKKKVAVIAVSSLVLVAMVVAVTVGVSNNGNTTAKANAGAAEGEPVSKSLKSIKTICEPTEFNDVCVDTLSKAAGNTTEPKDLVKIAYNVTIDYISNAAKQSETLKELEKDHRAAQALENCKELLEYAINDLNQSLEAIGQPDMTKIDAFVMDLKVWLSAAITYQETCLDGFENTTGNAGETMRNALKTSSELTRNGLAIITKMSESLHSLQIPLSRRLLSISSDGFPVWASATQRRLLQVPTHKIAANVVVAKDGSGNYKTINEALKAVPKTNPKNVPFVVYIKAGVYAESVLVAKNMNNVMFIGDGPTKTKITGRKNFIDGTNTYNTATVSKYHLLKSFILAYQLISETLITD